MSISGEIENVKHELKVRVKEMRVLTQKLTILRLRLKLLEEVNHKNYTGRKDK